MDQHLMMMMMMISFSAILVVAKAVPTTRDSHIVGHNLEFGLNEFCKKTTNPILCAQTIKPHFLHGIHDPFKALLVEVEATLAKAKKTLDVIRALGAKDEATKATKESLKTCKEQYSSMLDAIAETKSAIGNKDVVSAKFKFSTVLSYQAACQDAFDGGKTPFPEDSDAVYQLGGNCLDILADIDKALAPKFLPPLHHTPSAFPSVIGTLS